MKGLVVKMSPAVCDIVPNSFRTVRTLTHNEASDRLVEILKVKALQQSRQSFGHPLRSPRAGHAAVRQLPTITIGLQVMNPRM